MFGQNGLAAPGLGSTTREESNGIAATDYSPAHDVTIPAGGTETVEFRGQSGQEFGVDRMFVAGDVDAVTATARYDENSKDFFRDVHLSALRDMSRFRRLKGLLVIGQRDRMTVTLQNRSAEAASVNMQLAGYGSNNAVEEQLSCLKSTYGYMPDIALLSAFETVPAGEEVHMQVRRSYAVRFRRFFVGSDGAEQIRVALKHNGNTVMERVRVAQLQDRFLFHEAPSPYVLDGNSPLTIVLENVGADDAAVSALFEAYREQTS